MLWSLSFALLLLVVVVLRYWQPWGARCPQCHAPRTDDAPLCAACGWIFDAPEDDLEYGGEDEFAD